MHSSEILFFENYTAAVSIKNSWTRLASTIGCMKIILTPARLTIKPHWYAKWLIVLLQLDLCHEIPVSSITSVRETGRWFTYGKVEISFRLTGGTERKILLYLRNYREFIHMAAGARL